MALVRICFTPKVSGVDVFIDDVEVDFRVVENAGQIQRRINRVVIEFEGTVTMSEEHIEARAKR